MVVSSVYDVVFVVEDTANLAAYIDILKSNYVMPTLQYFNGGPPDSIDYGHDYSCSLYVLVTYNSGDIMSSLSANCTRPTTSIHEFSTWLDNTKFLGGAGQSSSLLSEGLSTALQVFDDIKARRNESISSKKHCILLCNSPPFHLPSQESYNYSGFYSNQLAAMMAKRGVNLSIISPRKIAALQELFEESSSPDLHSSLKDFTIDPRHMVLLRGYELEERSHSPSLEDEKQTSDLIKSSLASANVNLGNKVQSPAAAMDVGSFKHPGQTMNNPNQSMNQISMNSQQPSPGAQLSPLNVQNQPSPQMAQQVNNPKKDQQNIIMPGQRTNLGGNMNSLRPQNIITSQQQSIPQQIINQSVTSSTNNPNISSLPPHTAGNMISTQQPPMSLPSNQTQGLMNQVGTQQQFVQQQQKQQQQQQQQPNTINAGPSSAPNPTGMPGFPSNPGEKRVIWRGVLDYQEKPQKISRSLACNVTLGPADPDVNASNWPSKLLMQLLPQNMLCELTSLFKNSRQVSFNFNPSDMDILKSLHKIMGNGFAGCVHFPSTSHCDVRVLLLLYSSKKKAFIGLIPNDQVAFVQGIRTVLSKHKERSQVRQAMMSQSFSVQQSLSTPPQMQQQQQQQQQQQGGGASVGGVGQGVSGVGTTGVVGPAVSGVGQTVGNVSAGGLGSNNPMTSTPNMTLMSGQMQNQIPSTMSGPVSTTSQGQGQPQTMAQMTSNVQQQQQLLQQVASAQQPMGSGQPQDGSNVAMLQQQIQALQQELQGAKQEQAKMAAARQQQKLMDTHPGLYYPGPPHLYSAAHRQQLQQQQIQQRQLQMQQQQQQQQHQASNQQQLRHLLLNQQHMRQQQQIMMQRGAAPSQQPGVIPTDGQQNIQMQQQTPSQNFISDFNLPDNF